eukprot:g6084.t1 g6084   contig20:760634-762887(+)
MNNGGGRDDGRSGGHHRRPLPHRTPSLEYNGDVRQQHQHQNRNDNNMNLRRPFPDRGFGRGDGGYPRNNNGGDFRGRYHPNAGPPPPPPPQRDTNRQGGGGAGAIEFIRNNSHPSSSIPFNDAKHSQLNPTPRNANSNKDPNTPIPEEFRRTLILSNIPQHIGRRELRNHFQRNWNAATQFCHVYKEREGYVKFKEAADARRVWEAGTEGLDGGLKDGGEGSVSLVGEGVQLKAFHFNNSIDVPEDESNRGMKPFATAAGGGGGFDRKRNWNEDSDGGGGGHHQHGGQTPHKMGRHSEDHVTPSSYGGGYDSQHPASAPHVSIASNTYHRSNSNAPASADQKQQQQQQQTSLQIQLQQQKDKEYNLQWEAFQKQEEEWRQRRNTEYQTYQQAKTNRTTQISTLEQKRDLLTKQENMLTQQLPLHKKMLSMLKSKEASASEQSKKMKEILSTQTRIMELKKEIKAIVEEVEKLREEEKGHVFVPIEKRPVFVEPVVVAGGCASDGVGTKKVGGGAAAIAAGKRSLDRRTTVLRVEGFGGGGDGENSKEDVTEGAIKDHFSTFGTVSSVTLTTNEGEDTNSFALVKFANRIDAEKAKASDIKFIKASLSCTWYKPLPSKQSNKTEGADGVKGTQKDEYAADDFDEQQNADDNFYDDVYDDTGHADCEEDIPLHDDEEHMVDYEEEDELVDYD